MSLRKKKNEREPGARRAHIFQVIFWSILIVTQVFLLHCMETRAEEPTAGAWKEAAERVSLQAETEAVERQLIYEQVEAMAPFPDSLDIKVQHPEDGRTAIAACEAESVEVLREWWSGDFSFPVQFHSYDADYYQLGGERIPFDEERPQLDGCEELLLEIIGAPADSYRVTDVIWDGEAYPDEAGILCRNAMAYGEKRLRDYRVLYRGVAEFPAEERWQEASADDTRETEAETAQEEPDRAAGAGTAAGTAMEPGDSQDLEEGGGLSRWKQVMRIVTVAVSLLLPLFLLLAFLLVKRKLSWYTGQREHHRDRRKRKP